HLDRQAALLRPAAIGLPRRRVSGAARVRRPRAVAAGARRGQGAVPRRPPALGGRRRAALRVAARRAGPDPAARPAVGAAARRPRPPTADPDLHRPRARRRDAGPLHAAASAGAVLVRLARLGGGPRTPARLGARPASGLRRRPRRRLTPRRRLSGPPSPAARL